MFKFFVGNENEYRKPDEEAIQYYLNSESDDVFRGIELSNTFKPNTNASKSPLERFIRLAKKHMKHTKTFTATDETDTRPFATYYYFKFDGKYIKQFKLIFTTAFYNHQKNSIQSVDYSKHEWNRIRFFCDASAAGFPTPAHPRLPTHLRSRMRITEISEDGDIGAKATALPSISDSEVREFFSIWLQDLATCDLELKKFL